MTIAFEAKTLKTFTKAELERADGRNGQPALVAVDGKVYDVSSSELWKGCVHLNSHHAGEDLSLALKAAPHDADVLENLKLVGTVAQEWREPVLTRQPWAIEKLLMVMASMVVFLGYLGGKLTFPH